MIEEVRKQHDIGMFRVEYLLKQSLK
ncbi:hypothetical protein LCGC14_3101410, partial [marine sediment metagenome]